MGFKYMITILPQFTNPSTYMSLVNTIASLVALWGMSITFSFAAPILEPSTHVKPKFLCMQLLSVFHNLQSLLFNVLIVSGVFDCQHMLDSTAVGLRKYTVYLECLNSDIIRVYSVLCTSGVSPIYVNLILIYSVIEPISWELL